MEREGRAFARRAADAQASAVGFDDLARDRQAQARAFGLGREERRPDLFHLLRRDADAGVRERQLHDLGRREVRVETVR